MVEQVVLVAQAVQEGVAVAVVVFMRAGKNGKSQVAAAVPPTGQEATATHIGALSPMGSGGGQ